MINEVGRQGVSVVFAAGNRSTDLDENVDNGVSQSPYCVTVDAASPSGQLTEFSCNGQTSTDVLAPGAQILAPVTQEIVKGYGDEVTSRSILKHFFPEATNPVNILALDSFDATPQVRFFDDNPVTNPDAKELEVGRNESVGFTDRTCASINISSLNKEQRSSARPAGINGFLFLAIPVASVANAKWVGLYQAVSDGFMADAQLESIVCAGEDGTPIEVSAVASRQLKTGWDASTYSSVYRCQWTNISFNVDEIVAASNRLHDDPTLIDGAANYVDPGKATGVYGWDCDGKTYVIVKYVISQEGNHSTGLTNDTTLYLDNVAVANAGAYVETYELMAGTSMAAPAVTGCLAVIAKDEPASATLSDEELELETRERNAKLLAAVEYDDSLARLCRTGGRVDLNGQSTFSKRAPLITYATTEDDELTVDGSFFGGAGTLAIDGTELDAASWSDTRITASLSSLGLDNGSHVVKVTNPDGAIMQARFSYSNDAAARLPLYECTHSLPLHEERFVADNTHMFYGPMAYLDGSVYVFTTKANMVALCLWRYDVEADTWTPCELPEGFLSRKAGISSNMFTGVIWSRLRASSTSWQ